MPRRQHYLARHFKLICKENEIAAYHNECFNSKFVENTSANIGKENGLHVTVLNKFCKLCYHSLAGFSSSSFISKQLWILQTRDNHYFFTSDSQRRFLTFPVAFVATRCEFELFEEMQLNLFMIPVRH